MSMKAIVGDRAYHVGEDYEPGVSVELEDVETGKKIVVDYGEEDLLLDPTDAEFYGCVNAPPNPVKVRAHRIEVALTALLAVQDHEENCLDRRSDDDDNPDHEEEETGPCDFCAAIAAAREAVKP